MQMIARRPRCKKTPVLDAFADLIAEGVSPPDAAEQMGLCRQRGKLMLKRLRKRLGLQADLICDATTCRCLK